MTIACFFLNQCVVAHHSLAGKLAILSFDLALSRLVSSQAFPSISFYLHTENPRRYRCVFDRPTVQMDLLRFLPDFHPQQGIWEGHPSGCRLRSRACFHLGGAPLKLDELPSQVALKACSYIFHISFKKYVTKRCLNIRSI